MASLLPKEFAAGNFIVALVLMVITSWIFGYVWTWLYNRLAKYESSSGGRPTVATNK